MSILNAITNLITLLLYSQMHALHGLAVRSKQCIVVFFIYLLFAKEAYAANNHKDKRERYKCSETGNDVTSATRKAGVRGIWITPSLIAWVASEKFFPPVNQSPELSH